VTQNVFTLAAPSLLKLLPMIYVYFHSNRKISVQ